ncbi:hypothetical protein SAMN04487949_0100 [Halogranum gelatinilyticum]|uniref:Lipoprotein n=1 Tax=Halogranum gelatinilyticum TaxID=660521 RepID=A0A1G9NT24_9EURY|nr:hypothetical protein [Halogranum gelatinilyticum]SDL89732.1 hypothetical protein SAMN04487949_0100 [Halogranum gelatinilyticum]
MRRALLLLFVLAVVLGGCLGGPVGSPTDQTSSQTTDVSTTTAAPTTPSELTEDDVQTLALDAERAAIRDRLDEYDEYGLGCCTASTEATVVDANATHYLVDVQVAYWYTATYEQGGNTTVRDEADGASQATYLVGEDGRATEWHGSATLSD